MGYNACYGLPCNDSMTMYEIESKDKGSENFLQVDCHGNLYAKKEFAHCDVCGAKIQEFETTYLHGSYMYCKKCEMKHRQNERKKQIKNRKTQTKKAVKK